MHVERAIIKANTLPHQLHVLKHICLPNEKREKKGKRKLYAKNVQNKISMLNDNDMPMLMHNANMTSIFNVVLMIET